MTDYQYRQIISMLYKIVKNCKDIEEAKEEIKELLEEKKEKDSDRNA